MRARRRAGAVLEELDRRVSVDAVDMLAENRDGREGDSQQASRYCGCACAETVRFKCEVEESRCRPSSRWRGGQCIKGRSGWKWRKVSVGEMDGRGRSAASYSAEDTASSLLPLLKKRPWMLPVRKCRYRLTSQ